MSSGSRVSHAQRNLSFVPTELNNSSNTGNSSLNVARWRHAKALYEYQILSQNLFHRYGNFSRVPNRDKKKIMNSITKLSNAYANMMRRIRR